MGGGIGEGRVRRITIAEKGHLTRFRPRIPCWTNDSARCSPCRMVSTTRRPHPRGISTSVRQGLNNLSPNFADTSFGRSCGLATPIDSQSFHATARDSRSGGVELSQICMHHNAQNNRAPTPDTHDCLPCLIFVGHCETQ